MTQKKPSVQFVFPMPSADAEQALFTHRFQWRVSNQLEAAVIETAGADSSKMALSAQVAMHVFGRDRCTNDKDLKEVIALMSGLNRHMLKLIEGIYVTPSGEELPMVNGDGAPTRVPCYRMRPETTDDRNLDRTESFSIRQLSYFLENAEYREPKKAGNGWTIFRQAVGMKLEEHVGEDARGVTRQFSGVVFGRYPATPSVTEIDGKRVAVIKGGFYALGYAAFLPTESIVMLLGLYPQLEPFFQRVVSKFSGIRLREENQVRGLLPAPREMRPQAAKAEGEAGAPEAKAEGKPKRDRNKKRTADKKAKAEAEGREKAGEGADPDQAQA
ncbi:hypothetical protein K8R04_04255 [Candidatus Uhrbacteria bacterium]|nr:hypothetical protein [Candidatus Uhrbacteria bacterium]